MTTNFQTEPSASGWRIVHLGIVVATRIKSKSAAKRLAAQLEAL